MKTLFKLLVAGCWLLVPTVQAQQNWREATLAEMAAGTAGPPAGVTPRRAGGAVTASNIAAVYPAIVTNTILNNTNPPFQNFHGAFFGLLGNYPFRKLVVAGDSRNCTLTNQGWFSYGGITNGSLASTSTNQLDGTIFYNNAAGNPTNNISFWAVVTNLMSTRLGYDVALDTAMCVPGQTSGNIISAARGVPAYPSWANGRSIGVEQFQGNAITFAADGRATNNNGCYAGIGTMTLYSSNAVAYGSTMYRDTNLTAIIFQGVTYIVTNGYATTIYPTNSLANKAYTPVIIVGTPGYTLHPLDRYDYFPGVQNNYAPPYTGSSGSNGSNNVGSSCWLITNSPSTTGIPTAAAYMCQNNDSYGLAMPRTDETNQVLILQAATNVYNHIVEYFQQATALRYYPRIVCVEPNAYNASALGSQYAVFTNVNNMIRSMPTTLVDVVVDLDAIGQTLGLYEIGNPFGTNWLGGSTTSHGDGNHYSFNYTTVQGSQVFTYGYLSRLLPNPTNPPAGSIPAVSIGHTIIQTNLVIGTLYTNNYGVAVTVGCLNVIATEAAVAGANSVSVQISGGVGIGYTNNVYNDVTAVTQVFTGAVTNALPTVFIPSGATYKWVDGSTGTGNSCALSGGQIFY